MNGKDLDKSERIIRAGLQEAERILHERALELKREAPGLPLAVLEVQARRASSNATAAALWLIDQQRKLLEVGHE